MVRKAGACGESSVVISLGSPSKTKRLLPCWLGGLEEETRWGDEQEEGKSIGVGQKSQKSEVMMGGMRRDNSGDSISFWPLHPQTSEVARWWFEHGAPSSTFALSW